VGVGLGVQEKASTAGTRKDQKKKNPHEKGGKLGTETRQKTRGGKFEGDERGVKKGYSKTEKKGPSART